MLLTSVMLVSISRRDFLVTGAFTGFSVGVDLFDMMNDGLKRKKGSFGDESRRSKVEGGREAENQSVEMSGALPSIEEVATSSRQNPILHVTANFAFAPSILHATCVFVTV